MKHQTLYLYCVKVLMTCMKSNYTVVIVFIKREFVGSRHCSFTNYNVKFCFFCQQSVFPSFSFIHKSTAASHWALFSFISYLLSSVYLMCVYVCVSLTARLSLHFLMTGPSWCWHTHIWMAALRSTIFIRNQHKPSSYIKLRLF